MNWKRAKSLLIVMFFIVDLILFYQYLKIRPIKYVTVSEKEIKQTLDTLNQGKIKIDCTIPQKAVQQTNVKIAYKHYTSEEIITNFFLGGEDFEQTENEKSISLENEKLKVVIDKYGTTTYKNKLYVDLKNYDEKDFLKKAKALLKHIDISEKSLQIAPPVKEGDYFRLSAKQMYKGLPIMNTSIEIIGSGGGVKEAKFLTCDVVKPIAEKMPLVITSIDAINIGIEYMESLGKTGTIIDIRQGYYFTTQDIGDLEVLMIQESIANLVWIIKTPSEEIYINAFNGRVL